MHMNIVCGSLQRTSKSPSLSGQILTRAKSPKYVFVFPFLPFAFFYQFWAICCTFLWCRKNNNQTRAKSRTEAIEEYFNWAGMLFIPELLTSNRALKKILCFWPKQTSKHRCSLSIQTWIKDIQRNLMKNSQNLNRKILTQILFSHNSLRI